MRDRRELVIQTGEGVPWTETAGPEIFEKLRDLADLILADSERRFTDAVRRIARAMPGRANPRCRAPTRGLCRGSS